MGEAMLGFVGVVLGAAIGGVCSIVSSGQSTKQQYEQQQQLIWLEKRYEALRRIIELFDRLIRFTGSSDREIDRFEPLADEDNGAAPEIQEWNKICRLRDEIAVDIELLFDRETKTDFLKIFQDVNNGSITIGRKNEPTKYQDIKDEVSDFIQKVRSKYLMREKE